MVSRKNSRRASRKSKKSMKRNSRKSSKRVMKKRITRGGSGRCDSFWNKITNKKAGVSCYDKDSALTYFNNNIMNDKPISNIGEVKSILQDIISRGNDTLEKVNENIAAYGRINDDIINDTELLKLLDGNKDTGLYQELIKLYDYANSNTIPVKKESPNKIPKVFDTSNTFFRN